MVDQTGTRLLDIHGVGVLVAATIISEVGNPHRYPTKAKFAMTNGAAPIEASSGRTVRHRLNRGGNRQLNRAIHTAALTQIARPDSEGRRYDQNSKPEGKPTGKPYASSNAESQTASGPTSNPQRPPIFLIGAHLLGA